MYLCQMVYTINMVSRITYFLEYFKYLKNPISCLLFKFGLKKEVKVDKIYFIYV